MKKLIYLLITALVFGLAACNTAPKEEKKADATEATEEVAAAPNTLTDQEKKEGWILLFDGETNPAGAEGMARFPDSGLEGVIEAAEECPGECIFIDVGE